MFREEILVLSLGGVFWKESSFLSPSFFTLTHSHSLCLCLCLCLKNLLLALSEDQSRKGFSRVLCVCVCVCVCVSKRTELGGLVSHLSAQNQFGRFGFTLVRPKTNFFLFYIASSANRGSRESPGSSEFSHLAVFLFHDPWLRLSSFAPRLPPYPLAQSQPRPARTRAFSFGSGIGVRCFITLG